MTRPWSNFKDTVINGLETGIDSMFSSIKQLEPRLTSI